VASSKVLTFDSCERRWEWAVSTRHERIKLAKKVYLEKDLGEYLLVVDDYPVVRIYPDRYHISCWTRMTDRVREVIHRFTPVRFSVHQGLWSCGTSIVSSDLTTDQGGNLIEGQVVTTEKGKAVAKRLRAVLKEYAYSTTNEWVNLLTISDFIVAPPTESCVLECILEGIRPTTVFGPLIRESTGWKVEGIRPNFPQFCQELGSDPVKLFMDMLIPYSRKCMTHWVHYIVTNGIRLPERTVFTPRRIPFDPVFTLDPDELFNLED